MEKLKVYLDTNMILDVFINQAKAVRGKEIPLPSKYRFLLRQVGNMKFITSVLTKAEVARELLTAFDYNEPEIETVWKDMMESLHCHYIKEFTVTEDFLAIVYKTRLKLRTMMNIQHVLIAMKEDATFVTGDKDLIQNIQAHHIYDKVMSYIELRKAGGASSSPAG